jgi:hypothetical protein
MCLLPVTADVRCSPILVTLLMEALRSSETSVLTRTTQLSHQKTAFIMAIAMKTSNLS